MSHTVLVTGAGGFLGARLAMAFAARDGFDVLGTYRTEPGPAADSVKLMRCDLSQPGAADQLFADRPIHTVIHAAAALSGSNDSAFMRRAVRDNITGHSELLTAAIAAGCHRFIFCSTISIYEGVEPKDAEGWREDDAVCPNNVYGWSKLAGEELLRLACVESPELRAVSLRLAGIHGPGKTGGIVRNAARAAMQGETLKISDTQSRFRLVFVDDAIAAIEAALGQGPDQGYDCYNVAGEEIFTLPELALAMGRVLGNTVALDSSGDGPTRDRVMTIDRVKSDLSFRPRALDRNLADTVAWLKQNPS